MHDQAVMDGFKVQQIKFKKEELLAPYDTGDYGVSFTPEEKAEKKKQGP